MSKTIATLEDVSKAFGSMAKLLRLLGQEGVTGDKLQNPIDSTAARQNLARFLEQGCPDYSQIRSASMKRAREILGDDFISPADICRKRKLSYHKELLDRLRNTMPSSDVLYWLKENGYVLMAGPSTPVTFLGLCRSTESGLIYSKETGWYMDKKEKFLTNDKVQSGWLVMALVIMAFLRSGEYNCSVADMYGQVLLIRAVIAWMLGGSLLISSTSTAVLTTFQTLMSVCHLLGSSNRTLSICPPAFCWGFLYA